MGLESVFQYVGLTTSMIFPLLVLMSIYPWDMKICLHNWRVRQRRYFQIFQIKYWVFLIIIGITSLLYFGGMFEIVRNGGTYLGWNTSTSPLIIATLGSLFSTIWIPLWFIPLYKRDFIVSHLQAFSVFFSILAFFIALDYTASAWFMIPLCIINIFIFCSMWIYEERHIALHYTGEDLND